MFYSEYDFDEFIVNKHYDYLQSLTPIKRDVETLRFKLEEIPLHILENDYIFGWFGFTEKINTDNFKSITKYTFDSKEKEIIDFPQTINSGVTIDKSHTCANYENIINKGLVSYEKSIEEELSKAPDDEYLLNMLQTIKNIKRFGERLSQFTEQRLTNAVGDEKERLIKIRDAVSKVPYYPAESFLEALQSIWIIHFLIPLAENAWYSISLGNFDKYMYPYYLKEGKKCTSKDEIKNMLHNFFKLLNGYADGACAVNLSDTYNEFSRLLIECYKSFNLPGPIMSARISKSTPDEVFDYLIDERLFSMGQPTFYSDENCKKALTEKGITSEEILKFANSSCMGISIPGKEFNSMWGCVFNTCAALEQALNSEDKITDINDVYTIFSNNVKNLLDRCISAYYIKASKTAEYDPDVFLSIITDDCISQHKDRVYGAKYHNITVECFGMVNASDGICAIDNLVFKNKKYSIKQVNAAVKNNFVGYENIQRDILNCPKYGTDSIADEYAVRVSNIMADIIKSYDNKNFYFLPSLHTLDGNVMYGKTWGASYDGRLSGGPFAKNAGPCNEVRTNVPTALILSAAKLPQYKFYGGQPIDIKFDPKLIKNNKDAIKAAIKTYFQNGGLQLQVNALSSEILQDAIDDPQLHNDLIVRIGGYSNYFNKFSEETKQEFVERFRREEN